MEVRRAVAEDRPRVIDTLRRAFVADDIARFFFSGDDSWARGSTLFFGHYFDVRLEGGEVTVCEDDGIVGASLWNPPGGNRLGFDFVDADWQSNVASFLEPDELARFNAFQSIVEAMMPTEPHWYLGLLGTDPARRRAGVGRALLTPMLSRADSDGLPVFLETGNAGNVAIYERFGFGTLTEADVPDGPHVWGMLRAPA